MEQFLVEEDPEDYFDLDLGDLQHDMNENGYCLCLKVCLNSDDVKSGVLRSCLHVPRAMVACDIVFLPGLNGEKEVQGSASLFHRNGKGEVVFSNEEAERASNFIASFRLEERVKASLQHKRFVFPQKTEQVDTHFCNKNVYGKLNILWVCGVLRMTADASDRKRALHATATNQVFDAWPLEEALARTDRE